MLLSKISEPDQTHPKGSWRKTNLCMHKEIKGITSKKEAFFKREAQ